MSEPLSCVILGATGAMGQAVTRLLAAGGAKLMLAGRDASKLDALAGEARGGGASAVETCTFDARSTAEVEGVFTRAQEKFGKVDAAAVLVGSIVLKPAHTTTDAELEETLRLNLWPAFAAVRAAGKVMRAGGGSVVLMASAAARSGMPNHEAIAAAKGAIMGLTMSAAATYAPQIRVNCIAPGLVRAGMSRGIVENELSLKASVAMHAAGRVGEAADVAPMIALLLSRESAWITGQVIGVDGGLATLKTRVKV